MTTQRPLQPDGRVHGVILGLCRADGRWLMIRRSQFVAAPLQIAFPGGAVEPGESYEAAGIREAQEELGLEVRLLNHVWDFAYDDKPLTLRGYHAQITGGILTPDPKEVAEVLWMRPEEIRSHPEVLTNSDLFIAALQLAQQQRA